LYAIQLPGRGRRLGETPLNRLGQMVVAIADSVAFHSDVPFIFFGHSMGALIAFETARTLRRHFHCEPAWLYASGCRAPHIPRNDAPIHRLPDSDFVSKLRTLDGTPAEILESSEVLDLMLPALRADFEVIETYSYQHEVPLNCPISVFGGLSDSHVEHDQISEWRKHTAADFELHMLTGNHFFLHKSQEELLNRIAPSMVRAMRHPVGCVPVDD
jgi:medium-chain acyl-[acyl-carrier-protein] hydrolase